MKKCNECKHCGFSVGWGRFCFLGHFNEREDSGFDAESCQDFDKYVLIRLKPKKQTEVT